MLVVWVINCIQVNSMNSLKDIATKKHITIIHTCTIKEAMKVMCENKNGSVILIENDFAVGIITESDIINCFTNKIDFNTSAFVICKKNIITSNEDRPLEFSFDILEKNNIRRLVLVNKIGKYAGVVLQEDLFNYVEEDVYKEDLKIYNIVDKSISLVTVDINDDIKIVLNKMRKYKIGSLLVLHDKQCVGIVTEKDILKLTYNEVDTTNKVSQHMTSPVVTIKEDVCVTDAIDIMRIKNIRRIVIVDLNNKLVSLLTNRDILKHIKGNYTRILQTKIKNAQEIMNFLPEPIIEIYYSNEKDLIYWMNTQAQIIFGKNLIDKSILEIVSEENWKYIKEILQNTHIIKDFSVKIENKTYEISGTLSKNIKTNYMKLIFKDVTNYEYEKEKLQNIIDVEIKKRLDSEYLLMQQSKLATMGEMIGHIAHQWRQPLAQLGGIFMNLDSAYHFNELNEKYLSEKLENGNKLIKYMSSTIDDFRHFFEPNKQKKVYNISEYIHSSIAIIQASFTFHHIQLKYTTSDESIKSVGFPSEFSQVILNILANAQDILLSRKIQIPIINIDVTSENNYIYIRVEDNGKGIDEKNINKIFDIYFTTKERKEGSGLGLYMSKLIIETKLGGEITASNSKKGAVFIISLPCKY